MLDEVHVQNVALIREAAFSPSQGLTVVTGETGAGKTALLSAIKLLVGERADAATVREGASSSLVEGRFFTAGSADGCVARRTVSADGRSRVSIDGSMATVGQLAETIGSTVDLCGQHEHQHLLKPANHASMLDVWAGAELAQAKGTYAAAFSAERAAARELERVMEASRASGAQLEEARFTLSRIDEVSPAPDEYDQLMAELPKAEHAEELARAAAAAYQGLASDNGAIDAVNAAVVSLGALAQTDSALEPIVSALSDASYILEDASRDLRSYRDGIECDPQALERLQERASALQGLMRLYGPRMQDVLDRREAAAKLVESVDDSQRVIAAARAAHEAAEAELLAAAEALSSLRNAAAPRFCDQVNACMARLQMGGAELVVSIEPLERGKWTSQGPCKVEFLYRASANMTPRPLSRIASGGEMSRVMLSCKVALGNADPRETLVFDEVDAGVGGAVAVSLADVLADLAKTHQVIVVTHLAQVAVRANRHYLVAKSQEGDIPETTLSLLDGEGRVAELARMLSGDTTQASLDHARQMLSSAAE